MEPRARWLCIAITALALAAVGCVAPASEHGRGCPCIPGYVCCAGANRCVPAGEACPQLPPSCDAATDGAAHVLIDDLEEGNLSLGRDGSYGWYTFNDHTAGEQKLDVAAPTAGCKGRYALHMQAKGFSGWGTGIAFDLSPVSQSDGGFTHGAFDASAYAGVRFWAMSATHADTEVRLVVNDVSTDPLGGICSPDLDASDACYKPFQASRIISSDWAELEVSFDELQQVPNWNGYQADGGLSRQLFYSLGWDFPTMSADTVVDVWLDDIAWIVR